ncbi:MAG: DUF2284 domain-containing protein [Chloroflexota bacterium]|nr:DUF2284 domain-containing protein [Chloroflexota bacterium]
MVEDLLALARQMGISASAEFDSKLLVPEQRIRDLCRQNICGNYKNNYTCPPYVGSLEDVRIRLLDFRRGVLLQYSKSMDVKSNWAKIQETKVDFHHIILYLEEFAQGRGIDHLWGMIGGSCGLCPVCNARLGKPCTYSDKARMSLEAIGVDVLALLAKLDLDNEFHSDKIIWTGCILFKV